MHASTADLERFLLGTLPKPDADLINEHVELCAECAETLCGLRPDPDTVVLKLRGGAPQDAFENEAECQAMLERISTLGTQTSHTDEEGESDPTIAFFDNTQRLRDYQLIEPMGAGGMGTVYKARHTKLDKLVAIKVLAPHKIQDAAAVSRFEREMRIIGQLEHPHIVRATDAGAVDGMSFLVMELVDGIDLDKLVRERGPVAVPEACEMIRQAALGLQHAFARGVIHRDIKPSNLLLQIAARGMGAESDSPTAIGNPQAAIVKIADFGLALLERPPIEQTGELTSDGQLMGTLDFMAPEQGADTHRVDIRADVYSLGATLYKLLTGATPLASSERNTVMKKMVALATAEPTSLRSLRPEIPPALAAIVHRMLSKDPGRRPQTPEEVARLLAPFAVGADLSTLFPPVSETLSDQPVSSEGRASRQTSLPNRRRWVAGLAGLAIILLLGAIVFTFTTRDGTITVQLDSPQAITSIAVDGHNVAWTLAGSPGKYRFQVKPGDVSSIVLFAEDGTEVRANIPALPLEIAAGKSYSLTASVQKSADVELPAENSTAATRGLPVANHDRAVAEWAHAQGGIVGLGNTPQGYVNIGPFDALPAGTFQLVTIDLFRKPITDADLARLNGLQHFTTLMLNNTPITEAGIANLGELPKLHGIYISGTGVTDASVELLTRRYPRIRAFHAGATSITDAAVPLLRGWPNLVDVRMGNKAVTDASLEAWTHFKSLNRLALIESSISPTGIERLHAALPECKIESSYGVFGPAAERPVTPSANPDRAVAEWAHALGGIVGLGGIPKIGYRTIGPSDELPDGPFEIVVLDLGRTRVQDRDLARLDGLKYFSTLILGETAITDAGIHNLGELPSLQAFYGTKLTDAGVKDLAARYPNIIIFRVGESNVTDAGVPALLAWRNLRELSFYRLPVTDKALDTLVQFLELRFLVLKGTKVTREGVERLRTALPNCRIESNFGDFDPTIDGSAKPSVAPDRAVAEWAKSLGCAFGGRTANGWQDVGPNDDLPDGSFQVGMLSLERKSLTDGDLARLSGLKYLSALILTDTAIGDAGVASLTDLPQLRKIYFGGTKITDAGLRMLVERHAEIQIFHAGGTKITNAGVPLLLRWSKLRELRLEARALTDVSVDTFVQMKSLEGLSIGQTGISKDGVERLRLALPACKIESSHGTFEPSTLLARDYALEFPAGAIVEIPTLKYDGGPLTVEMTMHPTVLAYSSFASIGESRVMFWGAENSHGVDVDLADGSLVASVPDPAPVGKTVRVACVFDGQSLQYFVNGHAVAKGKSMPQQPKRSAGGTIGGHVLPSFRGRIDELRVSKVVRYAGDYVTPTRFENDADTVALYHFDEGRGDVLKDSSGNGHHGAIRGGIWVKQYP